MPPSLENSTSRFHPAALTPFTLLDFPGEVACIVWFSGCTMRCPYCHNPDLVRDHAGTLSPEDLVTFLETRRGNLTGVVLSGGEATLCPDLPHIAESAKARGYKVKLDTNGTRPEVVESLWHAGLVDAVALDYKAPPARERTVTGRASHGAAFRRSLTFLIAAAREGLTFTVRTTVHPDLLSEHDLAWIIQDLDRAGYQGTYTLQRINTWGAKTLGQVPQPSRTVDVARLPIPRGFNVAWR